MKVKDLLSKNTFVINMDKDKERLSRFYASFDKNGIKRPQRLSAVDAKNPKNRPIIDKILKSKHTYLGFDTEVGCALSHWSIMTKAQKEKWDYIVIFEDDVVLSPFADKLLERDLPNDWDMLYLGHCPNHPERNPASICPPYSRTPKNGWYRFDSDKDCAFGMYAYAISLRAIDAIIASYSFHCAIDYHILKNHSLLSAYGLYPCLVIHDYKYGSYSNPKRAEVYPIGTSLIFVQPYMIFSLALSIIGIRKKIFSSLSLVLLLVAWLFAIQKVRHMERAKTFVENFPGIYGIDSYAGFIDLWSRSDMETFKVFVKAISDRKDIFPWRHTLLGTVRDQNPIPWEREVCFAHSSGIDPPSLDVPGIKIRWIPYKKIDGRIHIEDTSFPYFMFKKATLCGIPIRVPDISDNILRGIYGNDCITRIRSPTKIEYKEGTWTVPEKYILAIDTKDL